MRVRRFCGFVGGGLSHRVSLEVSSGVCQGSQIQDQAVWQAGCRWSPDQAEDRAVTQRVVGGVIFWCVYGWGFADPRPGCCHTGCPWSCRLTRVRARVRSIIFLWKCFFLFGFFLCVFWFVSCPKISLEEDVSCESASNKLQKIADTFPCYLGSMLVSFDRTWMFVGRFPVLIIVKIIRVATIASSRFNGSQCLNHLVTNTLSSFNTLPVGRKT